MNLLGLPESGADMVHNATGMDRDSFLTGALGTGLEMLTDPLTYLGGAIGRLGAKAFAPGLERAALARGPNYGGGIEKLMQGADKSRASTDVLLEALQNSPHLPDILKEIPPGSQYLGNGVEAIAYKTPAGDVLRIEPGAYNTAARPESANILQPTRAGMVGDARIERTPLVDTKTQYTMGAGEAHKRTVEPLKAALENEGLHFEDSHIGNLGLIEGRPTVIDPGSVQGGALDFNYLPPLSQRPQGRVKNWLLDALGADEQVQQHLAEQAATRPPLPTTPAIPGYRGPGLPLDPNRPSPFREGLGAPSNALSELGEQLRSTQEKLYDSYSRSMGPSMAFEQIVPQLKQRDAILQQLRGHFADTGQLDQWLDRRNLMF